MTFISWFKLERVKPCGFTLNYGHKMHFFLCILSFGLANITLGITLQPRRPLTIVWWQCPHIKTKSLSLANVRGHIDVSMFPWHHECPQRHNSPINTHMVFNELSKAYPQIPHALSVKLFPKHQCMPKSKIWFFFLDLYWPIGSSYSWK